MEFNEGLQILKKMCRGRIECNGCPLKNVACPKLESAAPSLWDDNRITFVSETVEDWNKKREPKTWLEVLLERLPNMELNDGIPYLCPFEFFGGNAPVNVGIECFRKCRECWNSIAPDEFQNKEG